MAENGKQTGYLKEHQRLVQLQSTPHLPHALSRIEVIDFQGIKHLVIPNLPTNAQWIFLTGENGFGKTSLLRAIAKGLVGDEDFVESLSSKSRIYVNGYSWGEVFSTAARTRKATNPSLQIATYGVARFRSNDNLDQIDKKTHSLFNEEAQLINIERILIDLYHGQAHETKSTSTFEQLKKTFLKIIPQLSDLKVEYFKNELATNRYQLRYYEKGTAHQSYEPVKLKDLAAGYRSILTMIGDMMIRLSVNPKNQLDDLQGIVLMDEIDAHLHPKYQYELPRLLSEAFPKVQFIVSTHSPIPMLSLPKSIPSVVLTVSRTIETGITVARKDTEIEIGRLNPNALLTSPIFDFHQLFAAGAKAEEIAPTEDYDEVETMNQIKKNLQRLRALGRIH